MKKLLLLSFALYLFSGCAVMSLYVTGSSSDRKEAQAKIKHLSNKNYWEHKPLKTLLDALGLCFKF